MTEFAWFVIYFAIGMGVGIIVKWIYVKGGFNERHKQ